MSPDYTSKPPIYIDCRQLGGSGIGTYIENLIRNYAKIESDSAFEFLAKQEQISLIRSFSNSNIKTYNDPIYSVVEQFRWFNKIDPFGLLHIPHYNAPLFYPGQLIVTLHDVCHLAMKHFFPGMLKRIYSGPFLQRILNKSDHIITVSNFSKSEIIKYYKIPEEKITVIYNGVSESFQPIPKETARAVCSKYGLPSEYFLFVGNVKPHKNISGLITGYHLALEKDPDLPPLVILGQHQNFKKDFPNLLKMFKNEHFSKKIVFTGVLPTEDLPSIYSQSQLFIFPSYYEGFGLSILEAMACGVPVITSNCTSIPEIVGDSAELIDPANFEMIGDAILKLANDTLLQEQYREKGFTLIKKYSWEKSARKHLEIYDQARQRAIGRPGSKKRKKSIVRKEKANILFLEQYGDRVGGGQVILMDILEKFRSSGKWNVYISVPNEGIFTEKLKQLGFPYYCVPTWSPSSMKKYAFREMFRYVTSSIKSTFYLSQKVKEYDIDVVYCNGGRTFLNGVFLSYLFSLKVFFHLHLILENRQKRGVTLLGRSPSVKSIIAVSNTLEKQYKQDAVYNKIKIVSNWASPNLFQIDQVPRLNRIEHPMRIGVVGQISKAKGQWTVLESLRQSKEILPIQLSIFGDHLMSEIKEWETFNQNISDLCKIGWNIKNAGFKTNTLQIYDNLDILIMPSIVPEAFGLTAIEAMVRGVIVIANKSGALVEIIHNNRNGILYNALNYKELPKILTNIMNGEYDVEHIREQGFETVRRLYHPEKQLDKLYDIVCRQVL